MSNNFVNYYEILGVTPESTIDEIKLQRNRLLLAYHPDHNKSSFANEMTQRINASWEILSNPVRRLEYDEALKSETLSEKRPTTNYPTTKPRESPRKAGKASRRNHGRTKSYTQVIKDLIGNWKGVSEVERNLFEDSSGDLYYVKLWGKPLPSFFGLSASILRRYGSAHLHLIFYHAAEGFYVDLPFETLSARLKRLSYQPSMQQFKVHSIERDGSLVLKELELSVTPDYLSSADTGEHDADRLKTRFNEGLKKGLKVAFVALKIVFFVAVGVLIFLNILGGSSRR